MSQRLILDAKIGTGPGTRIVVKGNRVPGLHQHIAFKELPTNINRLRYMRWRTGIVDRIDVSGNYTRFHVYLL